MVDPTLIPEDEATRIAAVRRYDILDTPADGSFDRIIALAARHFDAPIVAAVPEGAGAGDLIDALRELLAGLEIRDDVAALVLEAG